MLLQTPKRSLPIPGHLLRPKLRRNPLQFLKCIHTNQPPTKSHPQHFHTHPFLSSHSFHYHPHHPFSRMSLPGDPSVCEQAGLRLLLLWDRARPWGGSGPDVVEEATSSPCQPENQVDEYQSMSPRALNAVLQDFTNSPSSLSGWQDLEVASEPTRWRTASGPLPQALPARSRRRPPWPKPDAVQPLAAPPLHPPNPTPLIPLNHLKPGKLLPLLLFQRTVEMDLLRSV